MDLRQIDALVAKQVMEERVIDIPFIPNTVYPKTALFTDEAASEWRKVCPHSYPIKTIPRYSSDIAAAWRVVERMAEMAKTATEANAPAEFRAARAFINWWKAERLWILPAPKAARRICLAALRAMGVEVPQDA